MKRALGYLLVFLLGLFLMFARTAACATLYVPDQYKTIQAAINDAVAGDEVVVRDGVYKGTGNCNLDLPGKAITVRSQNGPENCIIDCMGSGRGVYIHGNQGGKPTFSGFTIKNGYLTDIDMGGGIFCETATPLIRNCILKDNKAYWGGGIGASDSTVRLENCTFENNTGDDSGDEVFFYDSSLVANGCTFTTNSSSALYGQGSNALEAMDCVFSGNGISSDSIIVRRSTFLDSSIKAKTLVISGSTLTSSSVSSAQATIRDCAITGAEDAGITATSASISNCDISQSGGTGIVCSKGLITSCTISRSKENGISAGSSLKIANCSIIGNKGHGISCRASSPTITNCRIIGNGESGISCHAASPTISDCTIIGNGLTWQGGGIECHENSAPAITRCVISNNKAYYGGGISCSVQSSPRIDNCAIAKNTALSQGGGISSQNSTPRIFNCTISGNHAGGSDFQQGGGVSCSGSSSATLVNCVIAGNVAEAEGGGLHTYDSAAVVTNCTFIGNSSAAGGAVFCENWENSSSPVIANGILWADSPDEIKLYNSKSELVVKFSDVQDGFDGKRNLAVDPAFLDPKRSDFHLTESSPCVDKGTNRASKLPKMDKNGNPRKVNGVVDMGAYEYDGGSIPPVVSLVAVDPEAAETGVDNGAFKISRSGEQLNVLEVHYSADGEAVNGADYTKLSGTIPIPAGKSATTLWVKPVDDDLQEGDEAVVATLLFDEHYELGLLCSGTVTIGDNDK